MEIRSLNTLRGIAALIVVVSHFSNASGLWGKSFGEGAGQIGVMLFFLLSGFLMSHLYWGKDPTAANLRAYAASRVARVVPLYVLVVLLSFLANQVNFPPVAAVAYNIDNTYSLLSHLFFLHGESILWTIPPEMQFYFIFGISWALLSKKKKALPPALALVFLIPYLANYRSGSVNFSGFTISASIVVAIPYFLTGCIFGRLYSARERLSMYGSNYYLITLLLLLLLYPNIFSSVFSFQHRMWQDVGVFAIVGFVFFSAVFLVPEGNRFLENRVGDFLGRTSYSLYLLHLPVLTVFMKIGLGDFGFLSLGFFILVALLTAWLSYSLFESPCRRALRGLFAQQSVAGDVDVAPIK